MTAMAAPPSAVDAPAREGWQVGGVAAELSARLRASVWLIRVVLVLAVWGQPAVLWVYGAAALLIPRGDSRVPRWSGLVALARFGLLFAVLAPLGAGGVATNDLSNEGPEVWLPLAALSATGLLVLGLSGRSFAVVDEERCRRLVLGALPAVAIGTLVGAVLVLAPDVRAERVLAAGVVVLGVALALRPRAEALLPALLLALLALGLGSAGARLTGGVGDARVVAPADASGTLVVERAVGDVVVDLSAVRTAGTLTVRAAAGLGDVRVVTPPGASAEAELHAGRGAVLAAGGEASGIDVSRRVDVPAASGAQQRDLTLRIEATTGVGDVRVSGAAGQDAR
jgi:phage shock protein PspC (stress-responsive transcriptional regulator)